MQKNLIIISILTTLFFVGCTPHRIDIQQGNKVAPEYFEKLKPGMTHSQVKFILGSPLLTDPFHQDRWDYLYYLKPGNRAVVQSRLTLYFEGDELVRIDDSAYTPEVHAARMKVDKIDPNAGPAPAPGAMGGAGGGGHGGH